MIEMSLAPMMKITTPQFRSLMRKISPDIVLFTEMIGSAAVVRMPSSRLAEALGKPEESTVVQIGGSDPEEVAESVEILKSLGWVHFNLNCGCPSEKVQNRKIGAALMLDPDLLVEVVNKVYAMTGTILSLKIRTGVDDNDSYEFLRSFVEKISVNSPCTRFYVHARKCWLTGLNPKQNRNVPPLNYEAVYRLKDEFPHLFVALNGGIKESGMEKVKNLDGLMIGRHACENLNIFNDIAGNGRSITKGMIEAYLEECANGNYRVTRVLTPLFNLRKGHHNSRIFKQLLDKLSKERVQVESIFQHIESFID